MRYFLKRICKFFLVCFFIFLCLILLLNTVIYRSAKNRIFDSETDVPYNRVGLLLGTSKYLSKGRINLYYTYRINAAVDLYKSGKIEYILVSGDNRLKQYNEPKTIKKDLLAKGVPSSKIFLDFAGFRTLDSVVRSKAIFGQASITIISQQFHIERAIFIAKRKGINAVGYKAKDVPFFYGYKTKIREHFARVKMIFDMIIGKQPKFLGDKIEIL